jgi:long-chain acyl-CoA synthetase
VLASHPSVVDCAVFGIPDEMNGEAVMAVVQPTPDAMPERELKAALLTFLGEHVSAAKIPRRLELVAQLPRDETGKLQKRRLREQYVTRMPAAAEAAAV